MTVYSHALVLVNDEDDGIPLLAQADALAKSLGMKITIAHISEDYSEMNYISDCVMDDVVSEEVIKAKKMLSVLVASIDEHADARELVTMHRFQDVEKCINELNIDLVLAGHRNRFMGTLRSQSIEYINRLAVDVLIKHFHD